MHKQANHNTRECKDSEEIGLLSYFQVSGQSDPKGWVFSTGATLHICKSRDDFEDYRPVRGKHVSLISGGRVDVAGIGSVTLRFTSGNTITLRDVAHVPSLVTNFVSVGRFTDEGFEASFGSGKGMIYKNKKFVGNGCIRGGVFLLNVETCNQAAAGAERPTA